MPFYDLWIGKLAAEYLYFLNNSFIEVVLYVRTLAKFTKFSNYNTYIGFYLPKFLVLIEEIFLILLFVA